MTHLTVRSVKIWPGFLDRAAQDDMRDAVADVVTQAPYFQPVTPRGKPMSVRMSAAGAFGWITDARGYRYEPAHPNGAALARDPT